MSRLARKNINIPQGVTVEQNDDKLTIKGGKGQYILGTLPNVKVTVEAQEVKVESMDASKQGRANVGTTWSLIRNQIQGVNEGFSKILEMEGVGFKANMEDKTLVLNLGFVNPVRFESPEGITIVTEKNTITVSGLNKDLVGQTSAQIRAFKKPEPYKGKGIHYRGEVIRRKVGKKAGTTE